MINLLIAGYHGYGNCGDEATLMAMSKNIKDIAKDINITAISHIPELTKTEYNINSIQRFNAIEVIRAISKSDIILSGGGTLIQNGTSTRSLLYYLSIIKIAQLFKKKIMLYSNGIGPVYGNTNRKLVKKVLDNVDVITLREKFSKEDLLDMGISKPEINVTADEAFTLEAAAEKRINEIFQRENIPTKKEIIGISVRKWNKTNSKYISELAKVCDYISKSGKTVLFIPMEFPKDLEVSKRVMNEMKHEAYILKNSYKPDEMLGIIGKSSIVIAMRLHALLFAAIKKVPMIGIIYDPKIEYYLNILEMPKGGDIRSEDLDYKKICAQIDGMLLGLERYKNILDEKVTNLTKKALKNKEILSNQLDIIRKQKKDDF